MDLFKLNSTCSFSPDGATTGSCWCEFLPTDNGSSHINSTNNCTCMYNIKKLPHTKIILNGRNCSENYIFTKNCTATALKNCTNSETNCTTTDYNYKLDEESFHLVYNSSVCPNTNYSVIQLNSTKNECTTVTTTQSITVNNTTTVTSTSSSTSRTTKSGPTNLTQYEEIRIEPTTVPSVSSTTTQLSTPSQTKPSVTTTGRKSTGTTAKTPTVTVKASSTPPSGTTKNTLTSARTTQPRVTSKTNTPSRRPTSTLSTTTGTVLRSSSSPTSPVQSRSSISGMALKNGTNTSSTTVRSSTVASTTKLSVSPTTSSSQQVIASNGGNNQTTHNSTTPSGGVHSVVSPNAKNHSSSSLPQNGTSGSSNSSVSGQNGLTNTLGTSPKTPTQSVSRDNSTANRTQNTSHSPTYTGTTVKTTVVTSGIQRQANTSTSPNTNGSQSIHTHIIPSNASHNISNSTLMSASNYASYSPVTMSTINDTGSSYNQTNDTTVVALMAGGGVFQNLESELIHLYYIIPIILLMLLGCLTFGLIKRKHRKRAYPPIPAGGTHSKKRKTVRMSVSAPKRSNSQAGYQSLTPHDYKDYAGETVSSGIKDKLTKPKNDLECPLINDQKNYNDTYEPIKQEPIKNLNNNLGNQVRKSKKCVMSIKS